MEVCEVGSQSRRCKFGMEFLLGMSSHLDIIVIYMYMIYEKQKQVRLDLEYNVHYYNVHYYNVSMLFVGFSPESQSYWDSTSSCRPRPPGPWLAAGVTFFFRVCIQCPSVSQTWVDTLRDSSKLPIFLVGDGDSI